MRRSKYYSSSSNKPKHWLRNGLLLIFVGLPLALVLAEFAARNIVQATGADRQLSNPEDVSVEQAYRLQLRDANGKAYPNLPESGQLQIRRSAFLEYELLPEQSNKFWQINKQGFRQSQPLPVTKANGEVRIFILGGSTAFGGMAPDNQSTLAPKLEKLLNDRVKEQNDKPAKFKPPLLPLYADQVEAVNLLPPRIREGKYQVIAAAVPGYTSSHELSLLAHRIMAYSPDCVIVLDGYEDLKTPGYAAKQAGIGNVEQLVQAPSELYRQHLTSQFDDWVNSLYLVKVSRRWVLPAIAPSLGSTNSQLFGADLLPSNDADRKGRIERYKYNLRQMAKLASGIPIAIAIQPEITGKNNLTSEEAKIVKDLGNDYSDRIKAGYAQIEAEIASGKNKDLTSANPKLRVVNFYRLFNGFDQQAFHDPIHLTDPGNQKLAKELSGVVQDIFAIEPKFPSEQ